MHLKRFRAARVADALGQARAELGPDALVLATRLVPVRGWRGWIGLREVELTAAVERAASEDRQPRLALRQSAPDLVARLCAAGFDRAVAEEVAARLPRRARRLSSAGLRRALEAWSACLAAPAAVRAQIEVFVGPAGAGKTTTIAKIAAQARVRHGARLGLVSADAFRVGAIEQLRQYAEIIGSPFTAARTVSELAGALANRRTPLLVDTAGRSPRDVEARALRDLVARTPGARMHLVVPADATPRQLERLLGDYSDFPPHRVVLTKLDECDGAAPVARILRDRGLRVSYLGTGQCVPDDLQDATPANLAAALIGEALQESERAA